MAYRGRREEDFGPAEPVRVTRLKSSTPPPNAGGSFRSVNARDVLEHDSTQEFQFITRAAYLDAQNGALCALTCAAAAQFNQAMTMTLARANANPLTLLISRSDFLLRRTGGRAASRLASSRKLMSLVAVNESKYSRRTA